MKFNEEWNIALVERTSRREGEKNHVADRKEVSCNFFDKLWVSSSRRIDEDDFIK